MDYLAGASSFFMRLNKAETVKMWSSKKEAGFGDNKHMRMRLAANSITLSALAVTNFASCTSYSSKGNSSYRMSAATAGALYLRYVTLYKQFVSFFFLLISYLIISINQPR